MTILRDASAYSPFWRRLVRRRNIWRTRFARWILLRTTFPGFQLPAMRFTLLEVSVLKAFYRKYVGYLSNWKCIRTVQVLFKSDFCSGKMRKLSTFTLLVCLPAVVLGSYGGHDLFTSLSQLHSLWKNEQAFVNKMEAAVSNMETMVNVMKR